MNRFAPPSRDTRMARPSGRTSTGLGGLATLDARQDDLLQSLRSPDGPQAAMLATLVVTNCLLEIAKLASMRLTLAEFAQSGVDAMTQFAPLERCLLSVEAPGLPALLTETGEWDDVPLNALHADHISSLATFGVAASAIWIPSCDEPVGLLAMGGLPIHLADAGLVDRAAEQVSAVLGMLIEAEILRRQAAQSKLLEMLSGITDNYDEQTIVEITSLLQSLPGAIGAEIVLEIPRLGGPIQSVAGTRPENVPCDRRNDMLDRTGTSMIAIWWGDETAAATGAGDVLDLVVTTLRRVEQTARLLEETETDELTGIGNRRRASRSLAQAISRSSRNGEPVSVLLMDLDHFKKANDTHGHDVGDEVLRVFARTIESTLRAYDVPARWGGEEFIVVLPGSDADGARAVADRVLALTPVAVGGATPVPQQTVSIGIAVAPPTGTNPMELVKKADEALYGAKSAGRNRAQLAVWPGTATGAGAPGGGSGSGPSGSAARRGR
jgi:diguanylate cyclase (GGDEF)-like protein